MTKQQRVRNRVQSSSLQSKIENVCRFLILNSWCKVSRTLLPTILDVYAASQKRWNFAVLDIDTDNELTSLLQINKTPTVLLVNDGDVVDGMKGLAPEKEIKAFFASLEKILQLKENKLLTQKVIESIYDQHESQNYAKSNQLIRELLKDSSIDLSSYFMIRTLEAQNFKELKEFHKARDCLTSVVNKLREEFGLETLPKAEITEIFMRDSQFCLSLVKKHLGDEQDQQTVDFLGYWVKLRENIAEGIEIQDMDPEFLKLQQKWQKDPLNLQTSFDLANKSAELQKYELAIELLLSIIEEDKSWQSGQAVERIKELFNEIGNGNPLVLKARKQLSFLLF